LFHKKTFIPIQRDEGLLRGTTQILAYPQDMQALFCR